MLSSLFLEVRGQRAGGKGGGIKGSHDEVAQLAKVWQSSVRASSRSFLGQGSDGASMLGAGIDAAQITTASGPLVRDAAGLAYLVPLVDSA